ncbi:MAG: hypothetical protein ACREL6_12985, partial [Gemmatimonadales bacterium]
MRPVRFTAVVAALSLTLAACDSSQPTDPASPADPGTPAFSAGAAEANLSSIMDDMNAELASAGADYRAVTAEYVTGSGEAAGATVISKDVGNKHLAFDFVPNDPRREPWSGPSAGPGDDITYAIDQTGDAVPFFGGLSGAQTTAAIESAMGTWEGTNCSNLPLTRNPDFGFDIGVVAFLNGLGGSPFVFADLQHAGWRDINFAAGILGVTFTFRFIDGAGNSTDIDNNGVFDAAFREIYYDPSFAWSNDGSAIDVETVALHEAGHGLSQAHFG